MKRLLGLILSVVLFCLPLALILHCGQPPALTVAEVQGGGQIAKAGCKELEAADAGLPEWAIIACDALPRKANPDAGLQRRLYSIPRSEWSKVQ